MGLAGCTRRSMSCATSAVSMTRTLPAQRASARHVSVSSTRSASLVAYRRLPWLLDLQVERRDLLGSEGAVVKAHVVQASWKWAQIAGALRQRRVVRGRGVERTDVGLRPHGAVQVEGKDGSLPHDRHGEPQLELVVEEEFADERRVARDDAVG